MDTIPGGDFPGDEGMGTFPDREMRAWIQLFGRRARAWIPFLMEALHGTGCEGISESDGEESGQDEGTSREAETGVGEENGEREEGGGAGGKVTTEN